MNVESSNILLIISKLGNGILMPKEARFFWIEKNPKIEFTIDLKEQKIIISDNNFSTEFFEINNYKKQNMINGFDDIDYLINIKPDIKKFANKMPL